MLKNAYLLAKIGSDTAENDQHLEQHFAQKLPKRQVTGALRPAVGRLRVVLEDPHLAEHRTEPLRGALRGFTDDLSFATKTSSEL